MVSPIIVVVFFSLLIYRLYKYCFYRPENFPPGPPRIPFIGSYLFILLINYKNKHLAIDKLCKYYKSPVIGFFTGNVPTVVANDPKTVREMLFSEDFDGRCDIVLARMREPSHKLIGIFFTDGNFWLHQRRFTLRNLRDFGFGRRYQEYEVEVIDEIKSFVNLIKEGPKYDHEKQYFKGNGVVCFPKALIGAMGNCFLQVCVNERLTRADQYKIFKAGEGAFDLQKNSNEYGNFFGIVKWIRFLFPEVSSYKQCREGALAMYNLMKGIIDRQIETYQEGSVRNFMDLYIKEMKDAEATGESTGFFYEQIMMMCTDFLFPSLSAIQTQVSFLLLFLAHNEKIMKKIQDEIEQVVGTGRLPELDDRVNLSYTEAALREILRYETLVPSSVPHRAMKDTTLGGYFIPENTLSIPSLHALHSDKDLWKDPKNFRPERFLDENGKLSTKKDFSLPFGAGKRLCAGETFARNTMFLFIAALLQNFNVKAVGKNLPNISDVHCGLTRIPNDFWVRLESK